MINWIMYVFTVLGLLLRVGSQKRRVLLHLNKYHPFQFMFSCHFLKDVQRCDMWMEFALSEWVSEKSCLSRLKWEGCHFRLIRRNMAYILHCIDNLTNVILTVTIPKDNTVSLEKNNYMFSGKMVLAWNV